MRTSLTTASMVESVAIVSSAALPDAASTTSKPPRSRSLRIAFLTEASSSTTRMRVISPRVWKPQGGARSALYKIDPGEATGVDFLAYESDHSRKDCRGPSLEITARYGAGRTGPGG